MANAHDVAAYVLLKRGPMTAMKLQKLVYYSQAWHLVRADKPLFDEPIEAWASGPVVRSLYTKHRGRYTLSSPVDVDGNPDAMSDAERRTIDVVLAFYGDRSAEELSDLTHSEPPWQSARDGLGPTERGDKTIDPTEMIDYYASLARKNRH